MNASRRLNDKGFPVVEKLEPYRPTGAEPGHDGEAPVFAIKRDLREAEGKREVEESIVNVNCSRISYLYQKKRIELRQWQAAERLWKDWYDMGQFPKASNVIVGNGSSGGATGPGDFQVSASRRYHDARTQLELARNWAIVELVVEQQLSLEKAAGILHVDHRFASACLHCALHLLANHYKFA